MPVIIDPTNLTPETEDAFKGFLDYYYQKKLIVPNLKFTPGQIYEIFLNGQKVEFSFTHSIAYLHKPNQLEKNFIILDLDSSKQIAFGVSYEVFEIAKILNCHPDKRLNIKNLQNYIYKQPRHHIDAVPDVSTDEINKRLPYLHSKLLDPKDTSINPPLIEKNLGSELTVLYSRFIAIQTQDFKDYIDTAIGIIRAALEVHDVGITHRDLKFGNFLLKKNGRIKVIDFNLSKLGEAKTPQDDFGTFAFQAPETFFEVHKENRINTKLSDSYSVGMMLFLLHGGIERCENKKENFKKILAGEDTIDINTLFQKFPPHLKPFLLSYGTTISLAISRLLQKDIKDRGYLEDTLEAFLSIKHDLIKRSAPLLITGIDAALKNGAELHRKLSKQKYLYAGSLETMQKSIIDAMMDVNEEALPYFINEVEIKAFKTAHSKKQIERITKNILTDFSMNGSKLLLASQRLEGMIEVASITKDPSIKRQLRDIVTLKKECDSLSRRMTKCHHKLDRFDKFNKKYKEKITHLNNKVDQLNTKLNYKEYVKVLKNTNYNGNILRNNIRAAIESYLKSTLTQDNLNKKIRAGSDDRRKAIVDILNALETAQDDRELKTSVQSKIDSMKLGFFGRSGSRLYQLVNRELHAPHQRITASNLALRSR